MGSFAGAYLGLSILSQALPCLLAYCQPWHDTNHLLVMLAVGKGGLNQTHSLEGVAASATWCSSIDTNGPLPRLQNRCTQTHAQGMS